MKQISIKSSNIKSIFYDENKKELWVFFHSKHLYVYPCTLKQYNSFVSSSNKDTFFYNNFHSKAYVFKI